MKNKSLTHLERLWADLDIARDLTKGKYMTVRDELSLLKAKYGKLTKEHKELKKIYNELSLTATISVIKETLMKPFIEGLNYGRDSTDNNLDDSANRGSDSG